MSFSATGTISPTSSFTFFSPLEKIMSFYMYKEIFCKKAKIKGHSLKYRQETG
jgi:hypothetical protein